MKRILAVALVLACALPLGGCVGNGNGGLPGEVTPEITAGSVASPKVALTEPSGAEVEIGAENPSSDEAEMASDGTESPSSSETEMASDGTENPSSGEADNAESAVREDCCELYLQVLEDLWEVDSGLNGGISMIGMDLSGLTHLNEEEREKVAEDFAAKHSLSLIMGTWEELCDQGYINREQLYWEDGLFFYIKTVEDAAWSLPCLGEDEPTPELTAFNAHKWRSGLGAYFFGKCSAWKDEDGKWTYSVGEEAIS